MYITCDLKHTIIFSPNHQNQLLMSQKSIKRRLLRTRISLKQTLRQILNINRKRKVLNTSPEYEQYTAKLQEELRMLNHLAENQASLVRKYEHDLAVSN